MNIGSRQTDTGKRQGIKRLATTLFALCLPVIVATFLSGSLFDLRTLQASPTMDMSGMAGMADMASMDNAAHASGGHGSNPDYIPEGAGIITLSDAGFSPADLTVPAGSTVAWINSSVKAQSVRVMQPVLFGSPVLNTGNTFQYVFSSPGTYAFRTGDGVYTGNVVVFAAPQTTGTGTPGGTGTAQSTTTAGTTGTPGSTTTGTVTPGCSVLGYASISIVSGGGFSPSTINVSSGTSVTWTNNSGARARVRDINHNLFDSDDIYGGQTFTYTFCNSGTYQYENSRAGTTGVVVVDGGGSTATAVGTGTAQATGTAQSTTTAGTTGTPGATQTAVSGVVNIYMQSHDVFAPNDVTISTGTTVRWTNQDDEQHTSTSDTGVWNSGVLNGGQSFDFTFLAPGDYHYTCLIHGAEMSGWVHVTGNPISPTPGGSPTATPTTVPQGGTLDVSIQNFGFQPTNMTILVGTTVRWTNLDNTTHTSTSSTGLWNSGNLAQNAQFSYLFNTPGTYTYGCLIHPGMQGTITVVASLPTGTATSQTTATAQSTTTAQTTGTAQATGTAEATGTAQATGTTGTATAVSTPGVVDMVIQNYAFSPITITVQVGSTVKWTNLDNDHHTITSVDGLFTSGDLTLGQSWQRVFDTPGTYEYICNVHGAFMTGWVVVEGANACQTGFTDVLPGSTFYQYVQCLTCQSIVGGYADGTFRPNNTITRGQLAKIVSNAAGYSDTPSGQTFTDVPTDSTFYAYIERMAMHGVLTGYSDNTFRPGNNATRGQIAKVVSNAGGLNSTPSGQTFEDVPVDSTFYLYVERLATAGAMNGYPCGGAGEPCGASNLPYFRPGSDATRGQVTKIVSSTFFPNCAP